MPPSTAPVGVRSLFSSGKPIVSSPRRSERVSVPNLRAREPVRPRILQGFSSQRGCGSLAGRVAASAAASEAGEATGKEGVGELMLYNSLTRSKEVFVPSDPSSRQVSMYVCGVTVYDYSHIGHARVYVAFDLLYRTLTRLGFDVTYCRNFTDIDDKIIARAAETGEDPLALSQRFIHEFHADMETLGCLEPTMEPKATEHVGDIIEMIRRIVDNGHGYAVDGDVYFSVPSLPDYGRLSRRKQDDNRAGERVAVDSRKRSPGDFALWKAAKPGAGRPGWHIECSAMIRALLGPAIDIHGGGQDLLFPHHENEIAQSQAAACGCEDLQLHNGQDFVRYWVHNGFVNVDSEKMSKSLGNFFTIRDVLRLYHPLALRWFLIGTHYRAGLNYTQRALEEASDRVYYLYQTILDADAILSEADAVSDSADGGPVEAAVAAALLDDLNTAVAVAALSEPLKSMNDLLYTKKGRKAKGRLESLAALSAGLRASLGMMGFEVDAPAVVLEQLKQRALIRAELTEEAVQSEIEERAAARVAKDYARGDEIRDALAAKGVMLMDVPGGTTWRPGPRLEIATDSTK
eukprot:CAMPEP_0177793436 /NCGR_PEP_ID=MMETSP0491_2-20121128/25072_1 /TAXON_ID=63592 /ORGANISM="Tetraselmis chuii, Strain PLY429" /LENGTH=574 /DNA_ID=CAMNT_0019315947 /DNA_START=148 /DNA_END=1872 /DNA_ORIENTATION=-